MWLGKGYSISTQHFNIGFGHSETFFKISNVRLSLFYLKSNSSPYKANTLCFTNVLVPHGISGCINSDNFFTLIRFILIKISKIYKFHVINCEYLLTSLCSLQLNWYIWVLYCWSDETSNVNVSTYPFFFTNSYYFLKQRNSNENIIVNNIIYSPKSTFLCFHHWVKARNTVNDCGCGHVDVEILKCIWLFLTLSIFPCGSVWFGHPGGVFMCFNPADGNGPNAHFIFAAFETFV